MDQDATKTIEPELNWLPTMMLRPKAAAAAAVALVVWKFSANDGSRLSTALPLDPAPEPRPKPWVPGYRVVSNFHLPTNQLKS